MAVAEGCRSAELPISPTGCSHQRRRLAHVRGLLGPRGDDLCGVPEGTMPQMGSAFLALGPHGLLQLVHALDHYVLGGSTPHSRGCSGASASASDEPALVFESVAEPYPTRSTAPPTASARSRVHGGRASQEACSHVLSHVCFRDDLRRERQAHLCRVRCADRYDPVAWN